ncbi:MAG: hypothetical protein IBX41_05440 [Methanophagales archaeon]|nr:hypothetical protein [Methanophagales archaeon]
MAEYIDIRGLSDEKKYEWYEGIGKDAEGVEVREHESGFPNITIDYEDIHLFTDIFSVEEWWKRQK